MVCLSVIKVNVFQSMVLILRQPFIIILLILILILLYSIAILYIGCIDNNVIIYHFPSFSQPLISFITVTRELLL